MIFCLIQCKLVLILDLIFNFILLLYVFAIFALSDSFGCCEDSAAEPKATHAYWPTISLFQWPYGPCVHVCEWQITRMVSEARKIFWNFGEFQFCFKIPQILDIFTSPHDAHVFFIVCLCHMTL